MNPLNYMRLHDYSSRNSRQHWINASNGKISDVKVVSPYGEIAWHRVSRMSDEEMKQLSEDIVNRLYTFLFYLLTSGEPDRGIPLPQNWSPPQMEASIAEMWNEERRTRNDVNDT